MVEKFAELLLNYLSNIVEKVLPENPDEKELELITNSSIVAYAVGKTFGAQIVESTENILDDKALAELIESCENASKKYDFSLNAADIE